MSADLEILIPARNPTEVFARTIESLVAQADRNFRVLISDNYSTSGTEHFIAAVTSLQAAGIAVEKIEPPEELGRVEHWNWLHFRSTAQWVKPLFAGDWLEPDYLAAVRSEIARDPRCRYVHTGYELHTADGSIQQTTSPWAGSYRTPAEWQDVVVRFAMQFGPPSVAAYERDVFIAMGGYRPALPICADSLLYCSMAGRFGAVAIGKVLSHFNLHGARFSIELPGRQAAVFSEIITYITLLVYHAWTEAVRFSWWDVMRLYARQYRERLQQMWRGVGS